MGRLFILVGTIACAFSAYHNVSDPVWFIGSIMGVIAGLCLLEVSING